jgi:hypothetical protein
MSLWRQGEGVRRYPFIRVNDCRGQKSFVVGDMTEDLIFAGARCDQRKNLAGWVFNRVDPGSQGTILDPTIVDEVCYFRRGQFNALRSAKLKL